MRIAGGFCLAGLLFAACSSGGGGPDDGGSDDAHTRPDHDPSGSFLLVIPEGIQMCSGFSEGRDWEAEARMAGRIDLLAGYHVLEREEGTSTSTNPFGQVLFGPDRAPAVIDIDECQIQITTFGGTYTDWIYDLVVPVEHGGKQAEVDLRVHVEGSQEPLPVEIHLGEDTPYVNISAELRIAPAADPLTEVQRFARCELSGPPEREITAVAANGDRVELTVHRGPWYYTCFAAGETACLFLTRAGLQLGDHRAEVTDRLSLVYSGAHHNWFDNYLVLLAPPAGDVHALLAVAPGFPGEPRDAEFVYLDAALGELRREPVTDWTDQAP